MIQKNNGACLMVKSSSICQECKRLVKFNGFVKAKSDQSDQRNQKEGQNNIFIADLFTPANTIQLSEFHCVLLS